MEEWRNGNRNREIEKWRNGEMEKWRNRNRETRSK